MTRFTSLGVVDLDRCVKVKRMPLSWHLAAVGWNVPLSVSKSVGAVRVLGVLVAGRGDEMTAKFKTRALWDPSASGQGWRRPAFCGACFAGDVGTV